TRQEGCKEEDLEEEVVSTIFGNWAKGDEQSSPSSFPARKQPGVSNSSTTMRPHLHVDAAAPSLEAIAALRAHLDAGGVAALPTDTLYGLAADARNADAVAAVYALKGRDFGKPLPIVVRNLEQAAEAARDLPDVFAELAAAFWPGPLTLVVRASAWIAPQVTAGTGTVGMRQPDLPLLAALLAATGYPLTATSANRSGAPECRAAAAVAEQLGGLLAEHRGLLVDGGDSP